MSVNASAEVHEQVFAEDRDEIGDVSGVQSARCGGEGGFESVPFTSQEVIDRYHFFFPALHFADDGARMERIDTRKARQFGDDEHRDTEYFGSGKCRVHGTVSVDHQSIVSVANSLGRGKTRRQDVDHQAVGATVAHLVCAFLHLLIACRDVECVYFCFFYLK